MYFDYDEDGYDFEESYNRRKKGRDRLELTTYYLRSYNPYREHYASTKLKKVKAFQTMFPGSVIEETQFPKWQRS